MQRLYVNTAGEICPALRRPRRTQLLSGIGHSGFRRLQARNRLLANQTPLPRIGRPPLRFLEWAAWLSLWRCSAAATFYR